MEPGVDTDHPPAVQNIRSKFEQLALNGSPKLRPRYSNGSQGDQLEVRPPLSPRPRATSNTTSNSPAFDSSHLRSSSSSSDLKSDPSSSSSSSSGKRAPPPPPPSRPSKVTTEPPVDLSAALLRPVPIPPPIKALGSPRPNSPAFPPRPSTSYDTSRHTIASMPPSSYPTDTSVKPPIPPRYIKSDLKPQRTESPDANVEEDIREIPPSHPFRRRPVHSHHPSSESSVTSTESDMSLSSKSSRPSSRPSGSPLPPPLPLRRAGVASEDALAPSPRLPSRSNFSIPPHLGIIDSPSASPTSATLERKALGSARLPPPPTRTIALGDKLPAPRRPSTPDFSDEDSGEEEEGLSSLPDCSRTSRRPPMMSFHYANVEPNIHVHQHSMVSVAGTTAVIAHSSQVKIYDLAVSDIAIKSLEMKVLMGKDYKVLSMEFRPSASRSERGYLLWLGTKEGHLFELDARTGMVTGTKYSAHPHPILHTFRYGRSMVTIDESGKVLIWSPDEGGGDISLAQTTPRIVRVADNPSFVKIIAGRLWTAVRSETQHLPGTSLKVPVIRIYDIFKPGNPSRSVVPPEHVGAVTGATFVSGFPGLVYVGHEAGSVSMWSVNTEDGYPQCVEVMKISNSDVICVEGVNDKLWVGGRRGYISAFDVSTRPWVTTNAWVAHGGLPVTKIVVDHYGIDKIGRLCVVSLGRDEQVRFWDGLLGLDWIDEEMMKYEHTFTTTRPLKVLNVSWNCDSARPGALTGDPANVNFLSDALHSVEAPDIISFGFQEVIDLESRKMVAKNLLTSNSKNEDGLSEKVTPAYRRWNDALILAMRQAMPPEVSYSVIHTHSLVGLFSCVFIKDAEREKGSIKDVSITHVKRGMGGRYGNKGGIISRFVLDDTSICLINCHLAAGQNAVRQRNADVTAILEGHSLFPETHFPFAYVGGGDGSMVLDHEIVIVNGDMNYRIDHRRDAIISSIRSNDYSTLLIHDQLLREIKFNRACRFHGFSEGPLTFAPTYKYDRHSNDYDTSEKRRSPAWCDRVLWRSRVPERVEQLHYRRYEANVSDHKPISAAFRITIRSLKQEARQKVKAAVQASWVEEQDRLLSEAKKFYVRQALV